jgi:hypothetical protein
MGNEGDYPELPNGDHYRGKLIRIYVVSNKSQTHTKMAIWLLDT